MKLIVETTGDFQVYASADNHARYNRPSVVLAGGLMEQRIGNGQLKVLAQVNDDATDEGLVDALASAKGDQDLAVQAFASEFPIEGAPKPAAKAGRPKKEEAPE